MSILYLICGLPGAGKTTLAKQLEQEKQALRLCPDEWIDQILAKPIDKQERDRLRSPVEAVQWQVAVRALALGLNVILEWGFWSREERLKYRTLAKSLGAEVKLHILDVDRDELWARLARRNAELPPGTLEVTEDELDQWASWFQPPNSDELKIFNE